MYIEYYLRKMREMSEEQFQEFRKTDEYRMINADQSVREPFQAVLRERRTNNRKRERLMEALYGIPETLGWIADMQKYRTLRIEQAWISIAIRNGENDSATKSSWESLDKDRRRFHNVALKAFCKLVEKTSPLSNRDNTSEKDSVPYLLRKESFGDLYEGPLMIPFEEPDQYGNYAVRDAMTTGMFQLLKLIEETPGSDWNRIRAKVLEKSEREAGKTEPDIMEIQRDLKKITRGYKMSAPPGEDDFSTDLFEGKENRFKNSRYDGLDF